MNVQRHIAALRWLLACAALAAIVFVYRNWIHVNPTTVALTLLLYILLLASRWRLRHAVLMSIIATACYNYFFLPPVGTFTVSDPQNWLALLAFLTTGVTGSRLSQAARKEAEQARTRQREIELLFLLSRELLQTESAEELVNTLPGTILRVSAAKSAALYLLDGDRSYRSGAQHGPALEALDLRQLALTLQTPDNVSDGETRIPLKAGVRPRGLVLLTGLTLSLESFQAIASLVSIALDRAQALEEVARGKVNKESERLRTLILDSITHELRTPLTSIKGAASALLAAEHMNSEDSHELLTIVDEEADRLNRLIGQAVEMAQIEAQEVHMNIAPIAVPDLIAHARQSCAWVFAIHPTTINLPELPPVAADLEMVGKVFCNLLENAAKYSEPGSPIVISAETTPRLVLISVADRGIGIDAEEQALIFDRLYRAHTQSSTPGTGMGLAISRAIIESHHGRLTVSSQPGHGSTFTFSLPILVRNTPEP